MFFIHFKLKVDENEENRILGLFIHVKKWVQREEKIVENPGNTKLQLFLDKLAIECID